MELFFTILPSQSQAMKIHSITVGAASLIL
ncbi:MAG: hypothetical protein RLZZ522_1035, partial [Verrucomicrobiota bacterium]